MEAVVLVIAISITVQAIILIAKAQILSGANPIAHDLLPDERLLLSLSGSRGKNEARDVPSRHLNVRVQI
jgi:hypothetical protein